MKELMSKKAIGFWFIVAAAVVAVASIIWFMSWAPDNKTMDNLILATLVIGLVLDIVLVIRDNEYVVVLSVACYSIAMFRLLTNSVGSFVDAYQGITMFGDATQVDTIVSLSILMGVGIVFSIVAGFLKRVKE